MPDSAGAGQKYARVVTIDTSVGLNPLQELQSLFRLLGFVTLIVLPENLIACRIHHNSLHGRRAHVEPDQKLRAVIVRLVLMPRTLNGDHRLERSDLDELRTFVIVHEFLVCRKSSGRSIDKSALQVSPPLLDLRSSSFKPKLIARHRRSGLDAHARTLPESRCPYRSDLSTCRMNCAAVPATPSRCGT